jgi:hypothetical protein
MNAMTFLQNDAVESQSPTQAEISILTADARAFLLKPRKSVAPKCGSE